MPAATEGRCGHHVQSATSRRWGGLETPARALAHQATCVPTRPPLQGQRLPLPPNCPPFLQALLTACWQEEPSARPSMAVILQQLQAELQSAAERAAVAAAAAAAASSPAGGGQGAQAAQGGGVQRQSSIQSDSSQGSSLHSGCSGQSSSSTSRIERQGSTAG